MSQQRRRDWAIEMIVGAFAFIVLLFLGTFTIILSTQNIFKDYTEFEVLFDDVMGLGEGDSVEVRGYSVGKVKSLELVNDGVQVGVSLESDITLYEDYEVTIEAGSVLGGKLLTIQPGSPGLEEVALDQILNGVPPVDLMQEASRTIQEVRSSLEDGGILENLEVTMKEFRSLSEQLGRGEGTLGRLMTDDTLYVDLSQIAKDLGKVSDELAHGEGTIPQLLRDDTVYRDLQDISGNLKEVSARLAAGKGTLGRLLSEDDALYRNLNEATASINDVAASIRNGEGTLGKLTTDDELYVELQNLLTEARATLDDFRETAPITTFSSIFFGAF